MAWDLCYLSASLFESYYIALNIDYFLKLVWQYQNGITGVLEPVLANIRQRQGAPWTSCHFIPAHKLQVCYFTVFTYTSCLA